MSVLLRKSEYVHDHLCVLSAILVYLSALCISSCTLVYVNELCDTLLYCMCLNVRIYYALVLCKNDFPHIGFPCWLCVWMHVRIY